VNVVIYGDVAAGVDGRRVTFSMRVAAPAQKSAMPMRASAHDGQLLIPPPAFAEADTGDTRGQLEAFELLAASAPLPCLAFAALPAALVVLWLVVDAPLFDPPEDPDVEPLAEPELPFAVASFAAAKRFAAAAAACSAARVRFAAAA
jgi:hypothetical protein